ncbi:hypothetical protein Scani_02580 [Streptomyces caniferus]|uniref:Uncharacterized protein n=1 Tax=Streptomyces caniferus TaxID=285557 RepID=A0A640RYP4_9ACTN|nr:hypothetical protein Scani_02580 [Streptomyces caniferus]
MRCAQAKGAACAPVRGALRRTARETTVDGVGHDQARSRRPAPCRAGGVAACARESREEGMELPSSRLASRMAAVPPFPPFLARPRTTLDFAARNNITLQSQLVRSSQVLGA